MVLAVVVVVVVVLTNDRYASLCTYTAHLDPARMTWRRALWSQSPSAPSIIRTELAGPSAEQSVAESHVEIVRRYTICQGPTVNRGGHDEPQTDTQAAAVRALPFCCVGPFSIRFFSWCVWLSSWIRVRTRVSARPFCWGWVRESDRPTRRQTTTRRRVVVERLLRRERERVETRKEFSRLWCGLGPFVLPSCVCVVSPLFLEQQLPPTESWRVVDLARVFLQYHYHHHHHHHRRHTGR